MAIADVSIALASEGINHKIVVAAAKLTGMQIACLEFVRDESPTEHVLVSEYNDGTPDELYDLGLIKTSGGTVDVTSKGAKALNVDYTRSARKNARATRRAWNAKASDDKITKLSEEQFDVVAFAADHEPSFGDLVKRFGGEVVTALLNARVLIRIRGKVSVTGAGNKLVQQYTKTKTADVRSARNKG